MNRTRQAVLATTALACCLGGLPRAGLAQKAVGAVTQTQLTSEVNRAKAAEASAAAAVRLVATGTADTSADTINTTIKWTSTTAAAKSEAFPACGSGNKALTLTVKDGAGTAGSYAITITPTSGTVDGAASFAINTNRASFAFQCDGAGDWSVE